MTETEGAPDEESPDAAPDTAPAPPVAEMSFEAAMRELESVVDRLESGRTPLEQSIALYERGAKLKAHCERKLADAELKVAQIAEGADGSVTAKPADLG